jgi:hypothetical protein
VRTLLPPIEPAISSKGEGKSRVKGKGRKGRTRERKVGKGREGTSSFHSRPGTLDYWASVSRIQSCRCSQVPAISSGCRSPVLQTIRRAAFNIMD